MRLHGYSPLPYSMVCAASPNAVIAPASWAAADRTVSLTVPAEALTLAVSDPAVGSTVFGGSEQVGDFDLNPADCVLPGQQVRGMRGSYDGHGGHPGWGPPCQMPVGGRAVRR